MQLLFLELVTSIFKHIVKLNGKSEVQLLQVIGYVDPGVCNSLFLVYY